MNDLHLFCCYLVILQEYVPENAAEILASLHGSSVPTLGEGVDGFSVLLSGLDQLLFL